MDITKLIEVVKTVAATVVPGAPAAVKAAEAVVALVKSVAPTLAEDDQRALQAALPTLLDRMNSHVDDAVRDLKG